MRVSINPEKEYQTFKSIGASGAWWAQLVGGWSHIDEKSGVSVLYNTEFFRSICSVLIIASVIGATLNVIPFLFYDLTETRQKAMVNVLRIRAYFEDVMNSVATKEQEIEVAGIILKAKEYANEQPLAIGKGMTKAEKKRIRQYNEQIEIGKIILNELNYFNTPQGKFELAHSRQILSSKDRIDVQKALAKMKALPKSTTEEKEFRSKMISSVRDFRIAEKTLASPKYKEAEAFDSSIFTELFSTSDRLTTEISRVQKRIKSAKENKESLDELEKEIKALRNEQRANDLEIKKARKINILYQRVNKPAIDAQKCIVRSESYDKYMSMFV